MATVLAVIDFERVDGTFSGTRRDVVGDSAEYLCAIADSHVAGCVLAYMTDESVHGFLQYETGELLDFFVIAHGVGYP